MTEDVNGDRCYRNAVEMIDTFAMQDLMSESNFIHFPSAFPGAGVLSVPGRFICMSLHVDSNILNVLDCVSFRYFDIPEWL